MKWQYKTIPKLLGMSEDYPPRQLSDELVTRADNIIFDDLRFYRRGGFPLHGALPTSDRITNVYMYNPLLTLVRGVIVTTIRDTFIDYGTGFNFITKNVRSQSAGSVSVASGVVTLASDTWDDYEDYPANGICKAKFGSFDMNVDSFTKTCQITSGSATVTCSDTSNVYAGLAISPCTQFPSGATVSSLVADTSITFDTSAAADGVDIDLVFDISTWYNVDSWDSDTQCTLEDTTLDISESVDYVIRICWSSDKFYPHEILSAIVLTEREKMVVITNGLDYIQKYMYSATGDAYCEDLGTKRIAAHIGYFYDHLFIGDVVDVIDGNRYPQTVELADRGDPDTFAGDKWYELIAEDSEVKGFRQLQTSVVCYKAQSLVIMRATGNAGNPMDYDEGLFPYGTPSIRTVCPVDRYHIFLGWEDVYMFDGVQVQSIGKEIATELFAAASDNFIEQSVGVFFDMLDLYCLFVPQGGMDTMYNCYTYNVKTQKWSKWKFDKGIDSAGNMYTDKITRICDLTGSFADQEGIRFIDYTQRGVTWLPAVGVEGSLYVYNEREDVDGFGSIEVVLITKDYAINDYRHAFRHLQTVISGYTREAETGTLHLSMSYDEGETWTSEISIDITGDNLYDYVANHVYRGKNVRFKLRTNDMIYIESIIAAYADAGLLARR
jgi:hypothetical protein